MIITAMIMMDTIIKDTTIQAMSITISMKAYQWKLLSFTHYVKFIIKFSWRYSKYWPYYFFAYYLLCWVRYGQGSNRMEQCAFMWSYHHIHILNYRDCLNLANNKKLLPDHYVIHTFSHKNSLVSWIISESRRSSRYPWSPHLGSQARKNYLNCSCFLDQRFLNCSIEEAYWYKPQEQNLSFHIPSRRGRAQA